MKDKTPKPRGFQPGNQLARGRRKPVTIPLPPLLKPKSFQEAVALLNPQQLEQLKAKLREQQAMADAQAVEAALALYRGANTKPDDDLPEWLR